PPPRPPPFPYTTLFRSRGPRPLAGGGRGGAAARRLPREPEPVARWHRDRRPRDGTPPRRAARADLGPGRPEPRRHPPRADEERRSEEHTSELQSRGHLV